MCRQSQKEKLPKENLAAKNIFSHSVHHKIYVPKQFPILAHNSENFMKNHRPYTMWDTKLFSKIVNNSLSAKKKILKWLAIQKQKTIHQTEKTPNASIITKKEEKSYNNVTH